MKTNKIYGSKHNPTEQETIIKQNPASCESSQLKQRLAAVEDQSAVKKEDSLQRTNTPS